MKSDTKKKFTVISNNEHGSTDYSFPVTNPLRDDIQDLREKLIKFRNRGDCKKFSVDDLLKW